MDKEQVRENIEQLVESQYDRLQAQTRLRKFQDASTPPLAPSEFESLEAFLDFYGRTQDHEHSLESLNTDYTNATEQYDIMNASGPGQGQISIAPEPTQP